MVSVGSKAVDVKVYFNSDLAIDVVEKAALRGLRKLAKVIEGESGKLVPRDTGALARSVLTQQRDGVVSISYNTPYALRQHEEHNSKAKYLERPFNQYAKQADWYAEKEIGTALYKKKLQDLENGNT